MPVLSVQIADVDPSVSTDRSRLTIAPLAASERVPERQHRGDDRGQLGRDRRDCHADPDHEQLVEIVTVGKAEDDHERERDPRHRRDDDRQLVELLVSGVFSSWTA